MPKINNKKIVRVALILLILALAIFLVIYIRSRNSNDSKKSSTSTGQFINTNPPTDQEKKSGDEVKPGIIQQENDRNTPVQPGLKKVAPTITYAEQYSKQVEVGSYVNGIFEENGTCTLSLKNGTKTVTSEVTAVRGSNNVNCPTLSVPTSSLTAGTWVASVAYKSASAEGVSSPRNIVVKDL